MNALLEPRVAEFDTSGEDASHTAWLQAKLARSMADPAPRIPHDEVMRRVDERLTYWQNKTRAAA